MAQIQIHVCCLPANGILNLSWALFCRQLNVSHWSDSEFQVQQSLTESFSLCIGEFSLSIGQSEVNKPIIVPHSICLSTTCMVLSAIMKNQQFHLKVPAEEVSLIWPVTPQETSLLRTDFRGPCRWVIELTGFFAVTGCSRNYFWSAIVLVRCSYVSVFLQSSSLHHFVIAPLRNSLTVKFRK